MAKNAIMKGNVPYVPAQPEKIYRKLTKKDFQGMPLVKKAYFLAVQAHDGQYRKSEPKVPYIVHPTDVREILIEEGYENDKELLAAALLHDVVEDTPYTIENIEKIFGADVSRLVSCATEKKELSWEDRKQAKIDSVKNFSPREKLIIVADEISNLCSLKKEFDDKGKMDFSLYSRGEEKQKWKFGRMMESLCYDNVESIAILSRLRKAYNDVFGKDAKFGHSKKAHRQHE